MKLGVHAATIVLATIGAVAGARAQEGAPAPRRKSVLVMAVTTSGEGAKQFADFGRRLEAKAAEGARDPASPYLGVTSEEEIERRQDLLVEVLVKHDVSSSSKRTGAVKRVLQRYRNVPIDHFLLVEITLDGAGKPHVDFWIYEPETDRILAHKAVGGCGRPWEYVSEKAEEIAYLIGRGLPADGGSSPEAVIRSSVIGPIAVGTTVVLDGCDSADPDWDAMTFTWSEGYCMGATDVLPIRQLPCIVPSTERHGSRLTLTPQKPGLYRISLTVAQPPEGVGPWSKTDIELAVAQPPRADAGIGGMVFLEDDEVERKIELDASASDPGVPEGSLRARYRWRLIEGASVPRISCPGIVSLFGIDPVPPGTTRELTNPQCDFTVDRNAPGVYLFELEVRNDVFAEPARAQVRYLVAPRPFADAGPDVQALVDVPLELTHGASYDVIDASPKYYWELEPKEGQEGQARILDPHAREPTFVARTPGIYRVRLSLRAKRELESRTLWALATPSVVRIDVRNPSALVFLATDTLHGDGTAVSKQIVGANYRFLRDFGLHGTMSLLTYDLSSGVDFEDRFELGGGWTLGASWFGGPRAVSLLVHAGAYGTLAEFEDVGLDLGVKLAFRVGRSWRGLLGVGAQFFAGEADDETRLRLGFGIGYEL